MTKYLSAILRKLATAMEIFIAFLLAVGIICSRQTYSRPDSFQIWKFLQIMRICWKTVLT